MFLSWSRERQARGARWAHPKSQPAQYALVPLELVGVPPEEECPALSGRAGCFPFPRQLIQPGFINVGN